MSQTPVGVGGLMDVWCGLRGGGGGGVGGGGAVNN